MEAYQYGLAKRKSADKDQIIKHILTAVSGVAVLAIFLIILFIAYNSVDAFKDVGILQFLFGTEWDPAEGIYGAVPVITGTILVTLGAVAFAVPVGVGCAIYISEVAPAKYRNILKPVCEVFAGIPSVVYGFIGLILLVPLILDMFGGQTVYGSSWLAGSLLLGVMALPTVISVSEDAIHAVPQSYREASLAMGASKWETTIKVIVPAAISGISAAAILGIGRAIGETMAVMMVTGNSPVFPEPIWNIFSVITTITGTLAGEMPEVVVGSVHYSSLFALALVLMVIVLLINFCARAVIRRTKRRFGEEDVKKGRFSSLLGRIVDPILESEIYAKAHKNRQLIMRAAGAVLLFVFAWMMLSLFIDEFMAIAGAAIVVAAVAFGLRYLQTGDSKTAQEICHTGLGFLMGIVILILAVIIGYIFINGIPALSLDFLTQEPSNMGLEGGIYPAIIGTLELMAGTVAIALPLGIIAGVYLAEYAKNTRSTRIIREAIDILNGTPSIVFGLFGMAALVQMLGWGRSMAAGWITLALMILPVIIRTTEESIQAVPHELREASRAMGASKWQTTVKVILPAAISGVMTGSILAVGRAAGETAPIMFTAAVGFSTSMAGSIFEPVMALPYHLYYLSMEVPGSTAQQYGTACVLLILVLAMFLLASVIRYRSNKKIRW